MQCFFEPDARSPRAACRHLDFTSLQGWPPTHVSAIVSEQHVWRTYAAALIKIVDPPKRHCSPDRSRRERLEGSWQTGAQSPMPVEEPLFTERLVDQAIERGEKAKALKAAIAGLRPVLTPEQIVRLRGSERVFLPRLGPYRPRDDCVAHSNRRH